jgi:hypothetical protein
MNKIGSELDRIAFYGRTLSEYIRMFRIDDIDHLKKYRILDCPSGASSFVAEAHNKLGIDTVGCDPLFDKDPNILQEQGENDIEYVVVPLPKSLQMGFLFLSRGINELQETCLKIVYIRLQIWS